MIKLSFTLGLSSQRVAMQRKVESLSSFAFAAVVDSTARMWRVEAAVEEPDTVANLIFSVREDYRRNACSNAGGQTRTDAWST